MSIVCEISLPQYFIRISISESSLAFVFARPEYLCEWRLRRLPCYGDVGWMERKTTEPTHTGSVENIGPSGTFFTWKEL